MIMSKQRRLKWPLKEKTIEPFSFANLSPSSISSLYLKPAAVFRCDIFFTLNASRSSVVQKVLSPEETFALQMIWLILSSYSVCKIYFLPQTTWGLHNSAAVNCFPSWLNFVAEDTQRCKLFALFVEFSNVPKFVVYPLFFGHKANCLNLTSWGHLQSQTTSFVIVK